MALSVGHVDAIDIGWEDGAFALSVHDETVEPDVERNPASVRFYALPGSALSLPDDSDYAFVDQEKALHNPRLPRVNCPP